MGKETVEKITGLKISDKESEYLLRMVDVNRNGIMPQPTGDRKMSFYVGPSGGSLIKHNGSRLSILSDYREMQSQSAEKTIASKFSLSILAVSERNLIVESSIKSFLVSISEMFLQVVSNKVVLKGGKD